MLDPISEEILMLLDSEAKKLQDIADELKVSLDKVKRVSRIRNVRLAATHHLSINERSNLQSLGFKALTLAPFIKSEDWTGLTEILQNVSVTTTREELTLLIKALDEKKERIQIFEREVQVKIAKLEEEEKTLASTAEAIQKTEERVLQETAYLQKYSEEARRFLLNHLGIFEENLVLSKRLDSRWQKLLEKKGILQYEEESYVWKVIDLDAFVEDYSKRILRDYAIAWEYEQELKRNHLYRVPDSPNYKLPSGLAIDLQAKLHGIQQQKAEIKSKKEAINKEIATLKKENPRSFLESVQATDLLSAYDLKEHAKLQEKALKWLYKNDYIAATEITLPNNQRADVIGYNREGKTIIIEVKVNREDFLQDKKWEGYLPYCHEFYFLLGTDIYLYFDTDKHLPAGLLMEKGKALNMESKAIQRGVDAMELDEVMFSINRNLSRKLIYGY